MDWRKEKTRVPFWRGFCCVMLDDLDVLQGARHILHEARGREVGGNAERDSAMIGGPLAVLDGGPEKNMIIRLDGHLAFVPQAQNVLEMFLQLWISGDEGDLDLSSTRHFESGSNLPLHVSSFD